MPRALSLFVAGVAALSIVRGVHGEGGYQPPAEMIRRSAFIAIVTIDHVTPLPHTERPRWHFGQRARATVERSVKGALPRVIEIYGAENFVCQETDLSPGRYLAFLVRSYEGRLESANYQMGIRPIRGDSVEWYYRAGDPLTPLFGYKLRWQRLDLLLHQISSTPSLTMRWSERRTAPRPHFEMTSTPSLRATRALVRRRSSCSR